MVTSQQLFTSKYIRSHTHQVDSDDHVQMKNGKKICWNYRKGRCRFGSNCTYAHDSDLHTTESPVAAQEVPAKGNAKTMNKVISLRHLRHWNSSQSTLFKAMYDASTISRPQQGNQIRGSNSNAAILSNTSQAKTNKKRPGLSNTLVPSKKVMKNYSKLRDSKWTRCSLKNWLSYLLTDGPSRFDGPALELEIHPSPSPLSTHWYIHCAVFQYEYESDATATARVTVFHLVRLNQFIGQSLGCRSEREMSKCQKDAEKIEFIFKRHPHWLHSQSNNCQSSDDCSSKFESFARKRPNAGASCDFWSAFCSFSLSEAESKAPIAKTYPRLV